MQNKSRMIARLATSGLMATGMCLSATAALANGMEATAASNTATVSTSDTTSSTVTSQFTISHEVANVQGTFAYTQTKVTPTADIARYMGASKYLCGATPATYTDVDASDWSISVGGDVSNPYQMTIAELQEDPDVQSVLLGCSCAGNPADGRASVNAQVTGVAVEVLVEKAGVSDGANTIVFTSADGYEVALPLSYVMQRYCPIVFDVNGSPLSQSVGGTNQLWLGSTSAKYFARDIVSIDLETRDTPPAAPDAGDAGDEYANLPNVGIYFGGEVA